MMNSKVYSKIIDVIRNHKGLSKSCLEELKSKFEDLEHDTLYSILFLDCQKRMKVSHLKSDRTRNMIWESYKNSISEGASPGIILRIAEQLGVESCLVAKVIVQKYYEENNSEEEEGPSAVKVNTYLKDTSLINDMDLSYEVFLSTLYDIFYSPMSDTMKHSLGQQFEIYLHNKILKLGLAFRDEEHLRKSGYDKTPDIKLEVPVAVEGFVINWIESKALFGEVDTHKEYMKNQYLSYWNRFGPGLVIYWFGYVETIIEPNDKRFIIKSYMPEEIVFLRPPKKFCLISE